MHPTRRPAGHQAPAVADTSEPRHAGRALSPIVRGRVSSGADDLVDEGWGLGGLVAPAEGGQ